MNSPSSSAPSESSSPQSRRFVIACGGTGGHLFPGIAVAQCLEKEGHQVTLLISQKQIDALASQNYPNLSFLPLPAIAMPKLCSPKMLSFGWHLIKTLRYAKKLLLELRPHAVLGMGGFTSFPPIYAAKKLGIATYIHESNAFPGKANRLTSRWCKATLLGVKEAAAYLPGKTHVTGTPLRLELEKAEEKAAAKAHFGLDPEKKTILVMGGSQGAKNMNSMVLEAAKSCGDSLQFLLITGPSDFARLSALASDCPHVHLLSFCSEMGKAYAASDFMISRSGASSLCEIAHFGLPSLLIPFPFAADDHQAMNAQVYTAGGAGLFQRQETLSANKIAEIIQKTLADEALLAHMREAALAAATPQAAQNITQVLLED